MNELHWIWQTFLVFYIGRLVLRIAGRKSISQMTITQVVVMIGIGSLLIQPLAGEGLLRTFAIALLITLLMVITEYIEMKSDIIESISTGKSKIVIEDGKINIQNLKKLRMSVDRLETRLRQSGISSIDDVQYGTIEVSGQLGYELKENKKPATKEDIYLMMSEISDLKESLGISINMKPDKSKGHNIFKEIKTKEFEGKNEPPN